MIVGILSVVAALWSYFSKCNHKYILWGFKKYKKALPYCSMRKTRGWDPTIFVTWSLAAFSLCITLWQGWNCTMLYLSNPVTIEESFESLSSLPPIQLSICKRFLIKEPLEPSTKRRTAETILTFANSTEAFWQDMESRGEYFRPKIKHSYKVILL
jgi:hypothetical protein